ncbi:protein NKG7-like [Erythrolamprus reginae]|uniref:protein NKG7-like n=1 Tax=Erythrolamprus reginae TaxID=121349 RepID=UPI00396CCA86
MNVEIKNPLHLGAAFSSGISLLFLIIALSTDYWIEISTANLGLWKACNQGVCSRLGVQNLSAAFHVPRTFLFLGMFAGAVSLGGLCTMNYQQRLSKVSMIRIIYIASFSAGLCVMIAMSVFTGMAENSLYGWSFALGWTSFPFYLVTGGLTYLLHMNTAATA